MARVHAADQPGHPVLYDERWQEVWQRKCRGESMTSIAKSMGVSYPTVKTWYEKYAAIQVLRTEDPDKERAFLIGRFEDIAYRSMEAFEAGVPEGFTTDPRPAHMANAIKALMQVARLGGFDVKRNIHLHNHNGESQVTIRVGGKEQVSRRVTRLQTEGVTGEAIQVAARALPAPGRGRDDEMAAEEGETSGDD